MSLRLAPAKKHYHAIVIGSGPNGLAAAITLARAGKSVLVLEANDTAGGGMRSMPLTLPGFTHDLCSAIHPFGIASPFFQSLHLEHFGLEWIHAPSPLAHVLEDGNAIIVERDFDAMCETVGCDSKAYTKLFAPFLPHLDEIFQQALGPLRFPKKHAILMARLGILLLESANTLRRRFHTPAIQALFGGIAAHSTLPLHQRFSAATAMMVGLALHGRGWPMPRGGSQQITTALIRCLESYGGEIVTDCRVTSLDDLPSSAIVLFDTSPSSLADIAGSRLPDAYKKKLRSVRYGPSVFKLDWALDAPIPWKSPRMTEASTVHIGGTFENIALSESDAWHGNITKKPFIILTQPSLFDSSRAPNGKHTAWAYCHVPHGSTVDYTRAIEEQIEQAAPGFQKNILQRSTMFPSDIAGHNANNIGGDITGGVMDLQQFFRRPTSVLHPYNTPNPHLFLCSASTPPGPGVHGMCGVGAALRCGF